MQVNYMVSNVVVQEQLDRWTGALKYMLNRNDFTHVSFDYLTM